MVCGEQLNICAVVTESYNSLVHSVFRCCTLNRVKHEIATLVHVLPALNRRILQYFTGLTLKQSFNFIIHLLFNYCCDTC